MIDVNSDWDKVYSDVLDECKNLFGAKLGDYGANWLYFRDVSLVDQLWIKIKRIRTLEENNDISLVGEGRAPEFIGIINYAIVLLMKIRYPDIIKSSDYYVSASEDDRPSHDDIMRCYSGVSDEICQLCKKKNHDYGAAWIDMHPHSITDQIIIRVLRIKSFLENGNPKVSENTDAQLMDIVNYSIFGLLKAR